MARASATERGTMSAARTTTQRGYGHAHQRLRKKAAGRVAAGLENCWRCGKPIHPDEDWDLGHDDHDRSITRGPEHLKCNRGTKSRQPQRKRSAEAHPGLVPRRRGEAAG
jgi:hypothetical protein